MKQAESLSHQEKHIHARMLIYSFTQNAMLCFSLQYKMDPLTWLYTTLFPLRMGRQIFY